MGCRHAVCGIDEYAKRLIQVKTHQLIGKYGFVEDDREDIEQDLTLDLLLRMNRYDPSKAKYTTFSARIVEHRIATIIESRNAQCRDWRMKTSLNSPIELDGDDGELLDLVGNDHSVGRHNRGSKELLNVDLRLDISDVIKRLSPELQDLCLQLSTHTISEVARRTGIPRSTLYDRLSVIRHEFEQAGLTDYLDTDTFCLSPVHKRENITHLERR